MTEKETKMELKVDLQCCRCYKKVKKVLCKFPQIRDQNYDEKANKVTITVVCCSPEKIRDKIWCKGGGSIKCIKIIPPPPPTPPPHPPPPPPPPPEPCPRLPIPCPPIRFCCTECYHGHGGGPCYSGGPPPRPCYETAYGWSVYGGYEYYYVSRGGCFSEENLQGCSIM